MQEESPTQQDILTALEQVLASPTFTRAKKQTAFLRFVVEHHLKNAGAPASSFEIAIDCFNRSSSDPNDAYVRNIASQSRKSLLNYYNALPNPATVVIRLAEKGYQVNCDFNTAKTTLSIQEQAAPPPVIRLATTHKLLPTIAVIPLRCAAGDSEHAILGHMLSDSLITSLAKSKYMRVISRRTSVQFSESEHSTTQLGEMLNADYLIEGQFYVHGDTLRVQVELSSCSNDELIWAEQLRSSVEAVVDETDNLIEQMLYGITSQLLNHELQRALSTPLASLQCHSLLVGSINIMHRGTKNDFDRAMEMLELLKSRNPYHAGPDAYIAYCGLLDIVRDSSNNSTNSDREFVTKHANQALDIDSHHAVALTATGMIKNHFESDFHGAKGYFEQALQSSPNEASAMGRLSTTQLYTDSPNKCLSTASNAIKTSPFDPELYFFYTAAAFASFAASDYLSAINSAELSRRIFPRHPSNLRILVGSYTAINDRANAEQAKHLLLSIMPNFTVKKYIQNTPSPNHKIIRKLCMQLEKSGLAVN